MMDAIGGRRAHTYRVSRAFAVVDEPRFINAPVQPGRIVARRSLRRAVRSFANGEVKAVTVGRAAEGVDVVLWLGPIQRPQVAIAVVVSRLPAATGVAVATAH